MNFKQLLAAIVGRKITVLTVFVGTVALALIACAVLPSKYEGQAQIVLDIKTPDTVMGVLAPAISSAAYIATQFDVIRSRKVALRVIDQLGLLKDPTTIEAWKSATEGQGDFGRWVEAKLARNLKLTPSKESNLIIISYWSSDAEAAAKYANAFADAYIATVLDMRNSPAATNAQWFRDRLESLHDNVVTAQRRLSEFRNQKGLVGDATSRADAENARLNALATELSAAQSSQADAMSRRIGEGIAANSADVQRNPVVQNLQNQLAQARTDAGLQLERLGPNNPQYVSAQSKVRQLQDELARQTASITNSLALSGAQESQKVRALTDAVSEQRVRVVAINEALDEMKVFERELQSAQAAYDTIAQRYTQTSLESESPITNLDVVSRAAVPEEATFPPTKKMLLAAMVAGLFLGVGIAVLREVLNRKVRSPADFTAIENVGLRLLGSVPTPGYFGRSGRKALPPPSTH